MLRRTRLAALVLPGICLVAAPAARATCLDVLCVAPGGPGTVDVSPGDAGDGVICLYVKLTDPPPSDWPGPYGAPYVFSRSQSWGRQHPGDYDLQVCAPACPPPRPSGGYDPLTCVDTIERFFGIG